VRIRLLVLDVDGVLTDGRLYYGANGEQLKVFHVRDGHGIKQLLRSGIQVALISGRRARAVRARARELGIRYVAQGVDDKVAVFERLRQRLGLRLGECAYIGDDTPDVPLLRAVGVAFAVRDAHPDALAAAQRRTRLGGGAGAVREVCDLLLAARRGRPAGSRA
jgi:3-deoxy-D-manno-octulosonate 8-phosphate phosphatase (KDO 8-P phosphatase)